MHPGVAKFGIALEWGSRGLEFESRHSDQKSRNSIHCFCFFIFAGEIRTIKCKCPVDTCLPPARRQQLLTFRKAERQRISTLGRSLTQITTPELHSLTFTRPPKTQSCHNSSSLFSVFAEFRHYFSAKLNAGRIHPPSATLPK